jgi:hypothetical protein
MTKELSEKRGVLIGQDYWQLPKPCDAHCRC